MPRYKLTIEYDGMAFNGWQIQNHTPLITVQGEIVKAIKSFSGEDFLPTAAGRTDRGVHAIGQVAHLDITKPMPANKVRAALNALLYEIPTSILEVEEVEPTFDARFSCKKRHYLYKIHNRRAPLSLDEHRAWWLPKELNVEAMQQASQHLLGHHDFTTFRAAECQGKTPFRTLDQCDVTREGEWIYIRASARSFLHHQVRSIVGSLVEVGQEKRDPSWMRVILEAKNRKLCGQVSPAHGLYFVKADY